MTLLATFIVLIHIPVLAIETRWAHLDVHGQGSTQEAAYQDAWQTAEDTMGFLGYAEGEVIAETYEQGNLLWHCSMTVRCRDFFDRILEIFSSVGDPEPTIGEHLYGSAYMFDWITCTVASPVTSGLTRSVCTGWTGTGSVPVTGTGNDTGAFELDEDSSCTWHWQTEHWLELSCEGEGTLSASNHWQQSGSDASILARPAPGYAFTGWTGDWTSTNNPIVFSMDQPHSIRAHFTARYTANGTPHWWLIAHGLTNRAWDVEADDDRDGDGMSAREEFEADTNPTNSESCLELTGLSLGSGDAAIGWKGGVLSTQILERSHGLSSRHSGWEPIRTNRPPTATESNLIDRTDGTGDGPRLYRIRVQR